MSEKKPDLAFTVKKAPGGWVVVEYKILNGRVVEEKTTQPDLRAIALERFQKEIGVFWD